MRMRGKLPIFSKRDCWNMNDVLMNVIYHGVKKFRDSERYGHPSELESMEEWDEILNFIVESLGRKEPEYTGPFDGPYFLLNQRMPGDGPEWKEYMTEWKKWHEDRQKAMELFGRWCIGMWD